MTSKDELTLSIVVPVSDMAGKMKNLRDWISEAESKEIEIILVHDFKDEQTQKELEEIVESFPNLNIFLEKGVWGNPGGPRNHGMSKSSGQWIMFWDSDDLGHVDQVLKSLKVTDRFAKFVVGQYDSRDYLTNQSISPISSTSSKKELAVSPGMWRIAMRREEISHLAFSFEKMGEDQLFLSETDIFISGTIFVSQHFYTYFKQFPNQLTNNIESKLNLDKTIYKIKQVAADQPYSKSKYTKIIEGRLRITLMKIYHVSLSKSFFKNFKFVQKIFFQASRREVLTTIPKILEARIKQKKSEYLSNKYVVLTGGLGNQIFQLAGALGSTNGKVILVGCIGKPRSFNGYPDLNDLTLSERVVSHKCWKSPTTLNRLFNINLSLGLSERKFWSNRIVRFILQTFTNIAFSIHLHKVINIGVSKGVGFDRNSFKKNQNLVIGYSQTYRLSEATKIMKEMQSFNLSKYDSSVEALAEASKKDSILGIHVRLTDYKYERDFGILGSKYYEEALKVAFSETNFTKIWLFSDEPGLASDMLPQKYRDLVFVIDDNGKPPAYTLQLMRFCSGYIIANSTFSWWGARLSRTSEPLVIAPAVWFVGAQEPNDLVPQNWIRL